ncbi:MAG: hypothetical protein JWO82_3339, partial [Akkermansiaceae bacterium]|nr:hypothetical protein [Akkermansiaceae bacterium]
MSRAAAFKPKYSKTRRKWVLSLPPKHSPTGKRKRLLFDTEDEAKARAKAIMDERAPLPSWATTVDSVLIAEAVKYDDAVRSLGYRGLADFCDQHIAALEKAVASPRLGELLDTFHSDHAGNWSVGYAASRWKPFRNKLADLEEKRIANLDEAFWRDWFAEWRNNSAPAPATYNQQLGMLRSIFELRAAKVAVPVNPLTDLPALKDRRGDVPVFDPADARKLLLAAWEHDRDLVPFFAIGLFAGLRPDSELIRAKFEHIDRKQNHILVTVTKTRNHRRY